MYHAISKILVWLLYPLTLGLTLLVLAFWFRNRQNRKLFNGFFLAGLAILYLFSITPMQKLFVAPLSTATPTNLHDLKTDAIVVLGGSPSRSLTAIRLLKRNVAPVVIVSGGSGELLKEPQKESQQMKDFFVEFGADEGDVLVEAESRNTRENAVNSMEILDSLGAERIALVTSGLHLLRAEAVFSKLGYDVVPVRARLFRIPKKREKIDPFILIPNVENLSISTQAIYEYVAILIYKLRGWI